jgi:hypothetical protein
VEQVEVHQQQRLIQQVILVVAVEAEVLQLLPQAE